MTLEKTHIGDGVYAEFDGYQVWLEVHNEPGKPERIAIEPSTFHNLLQFVGPIWFVPEEAKVN